MPKIFVVIEHDKDGFYAARGLGDAKLLDITVCGDSEEEVKELFIDALAWTIKSHEQEGTLLNFLGSLLKFTDPIKPFTDQDFVEYLRKMRGG